MVMMGTDAVLTPKSSAPPVAVATLQPADAEPAEKQEMQQCHNYFQSLCQEDALVERSISLPDDSSPQVKELQ